MIIFSQLTVTRESFKFRNMQSPPFLWRSVFPARTNSCKVWGTNNTVADDRVLLGEWSWRFGGVCCLYLLVSGSTSTLQHQNTRHLNIYLLVSGNIRTLDTSTNSLLSDSQLRGLRLSPRPWCISQSSGMLLSRQKTSDRRFGQ